MIFWNSSQSSSGISLGVVMETLYQTATRFAYTLLAKDGEFKVTMEHPTKSAPAPLVIVIDNLGARVEKRNFSSGISVIGVSAPRAG